MNIQLPTDVLFEILLNSTPETLTKICQTNERLKRICNDEHLWRQKLIKDYPYVTNKPIPYATLKQLYIDLYLSKIKYIPVFYEGELLTFLWICARDSKEKIEKSIYEILPKPKFKRDDYIFEYQQNGNNIINFTFPNSRIVERFTSKYWYNNNIDLSIDVTLYKPIINVLTYGGWNEEDALIFNHRSLSSGVFSRR